MSNPSNEVPDIMPSPMGEGERRGFIKEDFFEVIILLWEVG